MCHCLSLQGVSSTVLGSFVNLTQTRIVWEEWALIEELACGYQHGLFFWLVINGAGLRPLWVVSPQVSGSGLYKKAEEVKKQHLLHVLFQFLLPGSCFCLTSLSGRLLAGSVTQINPSLYNLVQVIVLSQQWSKLVRHPVVRHILPEFIWWSCDRGSGESRVAEGLGRPSAGWDTISTYSWVPPGLLPFSPCLWFVGDSLRTFLFSIFRVFCLSMIYSECWSLCQWVIPSFLPWKQYFLNFMPVASTHLLLFSPCRHRLKHKQLFFG